MCCGLRDGCCQFVVHCRVLNVFGAHCVVRVVSRVLDLVLCLICVMCSVFCVLLCCYRRVSFVLHAWGYMSCVVFVLRVVHCDVY